MVNALAALVDIRGQNFNARFTAFGDIFNHLVRIVDFVGEHGCEVLHGVMCLEICRLIGDKTIGGAVRFVETVLTESDDDIIDFFCHGLRHRVRPLRLR